MPRLTTERIGWPVAPTRRTAANLGGELLHSRLRSADLGNDVAAVDEERRVVSLPQRRVQRRPALGLVDLFAGEERCDPPGKPMAAACATSKGIVS
jgi:hypothetical protein